MKPKIFCFINGSLGEAAFVVQALTEDGIYLAGHVSSNVDFAKHDIGITSDWKHEIYKEHYPDGYELEWVNDIKNHSGLQEAYKKNQALKKPAPQTENLKEP